MDTSLWFDKSPVIGRLSPEQAATKLREMGEDEAAEQLESICKESARQQQFRGESSREVRWPFQDRP